MVAHHGARSARFHHGTRNAQNLALMGAAIHEVAEEHDRPRGVAVDAVLHAVVQLPQKPGQGVRVAVNVADDVEACHYAVTLDQGHPAQINWASITLPAIRFPS